MRATGRRLLLGFGTACLVGLGLVGAAAPASASGGDVGYQDQSFAGAGAVPTADKPQSKLWFNDGRWWADMFSSTSKTWHIFWLDRSSGGSTWRDTGVAVDNRANASADTLWDGSKLYIATNVFRRSSAASAPNNPARLYRYSYSSSTKKYTLDPGFPSTINNYSSESLTIDEDSRGVLWATWTQVSGTGTSATNAVYLNALSAGSATWGTPFLVPASNTNPHPAPDDISAVVAFGGSKVGVLWSNQLDGTVYWAVHSDGAPRTTWVGGIAVRGSKMADDHMNLKAIQTDAAGRVFAVVKTSLDHSRSATPQSPLIDLLVFKPGTGSWTTTTFGRIVDCHTRPQLLLDDANQTVYVVATGPTASGVCTATGDGTIYMKSAPMSNPVFTTGVGTPIIRDAASDALNNPTTTKQTVSGATGLVVLASNETTDRYWHADIPLGPSMPAAPTASFTASPTSGVAPLAVSFTDTSTGSPTSWAWSFGDGGTATTQNPSHTFSAAGSYTVTLRASNAAGTSAPVSKTIEVTSSVPPSAGGAVSVGSSTTATSASAAATVSVTRPAGVVDGDVLVAQMTVDYAPKVRSAPPGWSAVVAPINVKSRATVLAYYHVVSSAAAEPASYAWTLSSGVKWNAGITDFHGVDTASPFDTPAVTAASTGSTSTKLTVPGVTTVTAGAMVIGGVGANNSTATAVAPTGWTEALEATSAQVTELADQARPATGTTGSATWTYSRAVNAGGWLRALKPA